MTVEKLLVALKAKEAVIAAVEDELRDAEAALASQAELLIEAERVLEPFANADARVTGFDPADGGYYHAHTVQYVGLHDYEAARSLLLRIQAVKGGENA